MNARAIWWWLLAAGALFVLVVLNQRYGHAPPNPVAPLLPNLKAAAVSSVQVRPPGPMSLQIRAERTNGTWVLTEPLVYPAQATSIENLLATLEHLTPAARVSETEIRHRPNADEEYGFATPQASLLIQQGVQQTRVIIGSRTPPGDQVYLEVVGVEGAFVVGAELLQSIPQSANDWRDATLIRSELAAVDRIAVTNGGNGFVLQRDATNRLWRFMWPLPLARADNARIEQSLHQLEALRVRQFVSDQPSELESFGLAPAQTELALNRGTNNLGWLQIGKALTNDASQLYARRAGQNGLFTVTRDLVASWRSAWDAFRDPHLLNVAEEVALVRVTGQDSFSLVRRTNETWRVMPADLAADSEFVTQFLAQLANQRITEYVKDIVNAPDWPIYGLAAPVRQYVLERPGSSSSGESNAVIVELNFGLSTNQPDKVLARRSDESSVYAISTNDFARLPSASWQFRDRALWRFTTNDVARITIRQQGKTCELARKGPFSWAVVSGSGIFNDLAVEETVQALGQASAAAWVGCGEQNRSCFGFAEQGYQITLELKNGDKPAFEFGGVAPNGNRYAAVTLDGQFRILEFPWSLYRQVAAYLRNQ